MMMVVHLKRLEADMVEHPYSECGDYHWPIYSSGRWLALFVVVLLCKTKHDQESLFTMATNAVIQNAVSTFTKLFHVLI